MSTQVKTPPLTRLERVQQLCWALFHAVGVVLPKVGVGVEELDTRDLLEHQVGPWANQRSDVHIPFVP